MIKEAEYFLELLKAYYDKETLALKDNIDYTKLYRIAHNHNLSAIVFCVLNTSENKELVPDGVFKRFEEEFYEALVRYDTQKEIIADADRILSSERIKHVFIKGAELKEYYPVPEARIMGDIDILIPADCRNAARDALVKNGFELINKNGPVYTYVRDGIKLEVHTKIISGKVGNSDAETGFEDAIEHAEYNGCSGRLEPSYHYAYQIAHIAHHFWFYGAGAKLILDLAVTDRQFDIDYDKVLETLKKVRLDDFGKVIISVCSKWFDAGVDYGADTEETERFLLKYGAFGNINRNESAVYQRKALEEGKGKSKTLTRLALLFPSYEKMKNIPYISFIEGKPYLVPLAWVYRIYYNFRNRSKFVTSTAKNIGSDETKSDAEHELAYFKEIGLL